MRSRLFRLIYMVLCLFIVLQGQVAFAQTETPLQAPIYQMAISGDRRVLAVTYIGFDNGSLVQFFSNETGELLGTVDLSPDFPRLIALSPTGDRLLWADSSARVGVYDRTRSNNTIIAGPGMFFLDAIAWNPTNNVIGFTAGTSIRLWDVGSLQRIGSIDAGNLTPVFFAWSPDGQHMVTSHATTPMPNVTVPTTNIRLWDNTMPDAGVRIDTPIVELLSRGGGRVAWSPDGERFAVLEEGGMLIYNIMDETIETIFIDEPSVGMLDWSPDGNYLATGGAIIHIWDTITWEVVDTIESVGGGVALYWSFDGQQIFHNGGPDGIYVDDVLVDETQED